MKAIILAGGFGTRLSEETLVVPKPMVDIGGKPILWHIMNLYSAHGIKEFVICLGYKAGYVKKFFSEYSTTTSDFTINLRDGNINIHRQKAEDWTISLLDTGMETMTGGRIKRALEFLENEATYCLTYGDGLSDLDISKSILFHQNHGKLCTVTSVTPPGRFGVLDINTDDLVIGFREKIVSDQYRINGGFFVIEHGVLDYIGGDATIWEQDPLMNLANDEQLMAWKHDGFWQPMDTLRDKNFLQELWDKGDAPWKVENVTIR